MSEASTFLQWKGTDVCLDFHCKCGNSFHVHGYFVYYVKCMECETVYKMPDDPKPIIVGELFMEPSIGDQEEKAPPETEVVKHAPMVEALLNHSAKLVKDTFGVEHICDKCHKPKRPWLKIQHKGVCRCEVKT